LTHTSDCYQLVQKTYEARDDGPEAAGCGALGRSGREIRVKFDADKTKTLARRARSIFSLLHGLHRLCQVSDTAV
jgi:hypothetical protein